MHAENCMVLTTSAHARCNPRRDLLTQLMQLNCNWLQHKRLCELLAAPTCTAVSSREKRQLTQSHSWKWFLYWHRNIETARRRRSRPARVGARVRARVWLVKWKEMWIWVMSSFLNPHFLFRYLYPDPPASLLPPPTSTHSASSHPSLPTSLLSLSSICIRNRIWGTMLSYHRSESGREWVRTKDREKSSLWRPRDGETERKWETEREDKKKGGQQFLFALPSSISCFKHSTSEAP